MGEVYTIVVLATFSRINQSIKIQELTGLLKLVTVRFPQRRQYWDYGSA